MRDSVAGPVSSEGRAGQTSSDRIGPMGFDLGQPLGAARGRERSERPQAPLERVWKVLTARLPPVPAFDPTVGVTTPVQLGPFPPL